jgi:hypothetical protein
LQRLVKEIDNAGTYAQLSYAEERHNVHQHACQSDELGTQTVEEYLSGEESQKQAQHIEYHADLDIHDASVYPFAHLSELL